ncbi:hypothetical protein D3C86_1226670 [compost metagenome]
MDIRDFFQFQRAFQCHREVIATAQIQEVLCILQLLCYHFDLCIQLQRLLNFLRQIFQFIQYLTQVRIGNSTFLLSDLQSHQRQDDNLSRKCFGRSHTYFRASMGIRTGMRYAGNRRTDYITDTINQRLTLFRNLNRCQCISSFSGLRDCQDDISFIDDRVTVTEFRSIFHLNRYACQRFDQVFTDQTRVP